MKPRAIRYEFESYREVLDEFSKLLLHRNSQDYKKRTSRSMSLHDPAAEQLGRFLRSSRRELALSQKELAAMAGISQATIMALECGLIASDQIDRAWLDALAYALGEDSDTFDLLLGTAVEIPQTEDTGSIQSFAKLKRNQRCGANEAIEFLHLVGMQPEQILEVNPSSDYFPEGEWQEAWNQYLIDHQALLYEGPSRPTISLLNKIAANNFWDVPGVTGYTMLRSIAVRLATSRPERVGDEERVSWFSYLVRKFVYLGGNKHQVGPVEKNDLWNWLEQVWLQLEDNEDKLWPLEWKAYYSEVLHMFQAAAEMAEQVVDVARQRQEPKLFEAALVVRSAHCWEQAGDLRKAVKRYVEAADLMTNEDRISLRGIVHYQTACRLDTNIAHRDSIQKKIKNLQELVESKVNKRCGKIALVCNEFDTDLAADVLAHSFLERGIVCETKQSSNLNDLIDLSTTFRACCVVGGAKAIWTDNHLHQYFYDDCPSLIRESKLRELDVQGLHYSDIWYQNVGRMAAYAIGGLTREETFLAVEKFCNSEEFEKLISIVRMD